MSADVNIKTIQTVYEAFGRGDVVAITDVVTDDVDWASDTASTAAPWYGVRHGKDGVVSFFEAFGSTMNVDQFESISFAGNDTEVHTVVRFQATRRANGASVSMNLHHFFQFRGGKISYYRGTEDSALTEAAFRD
jgi:ketosteroid isomerase-like protein